jgi:signal transduction histidine kinase
VESGRLAQEQAALAKQQAALRRVATLVARGAPPPKVFSAVAHELAEEFRASITAVLRYEDDETATIVGGWGEPGRQIPTGTRLKTAGQGAISALRTGAAVRVEHFDGPPGSAARFFREAGMTVGAGSPITVDGRLWGIAVAASRNPGAFPAGSETRIADFTERAAAAIANAETQAQLIQSRARIVATADQTRRKIEHDLHDGAQQRLVSLALRLRMARAAVPPELGLLGAELERVTAGLTDALEELREYARGIHPAILTEGGLGSALKTLAQRCLIPVNLDIRTEGRLPGPVEVAAYYVVSEALANAAKHANAAKAAVCVEAVTGVLRVSVRDDGCGGADFTGGTGLAGLKDRVEALGGQIFLRSPPGAGTALHVELPLTNTVAAHRSD